MACSIRYRLDAAGPAVYVVECDGRYHFYSRGALGNPLPVDELPALLAGRGGRWLPAMGDLSFSGLLPSDPFHLQGNDRPRLPNGIDDIQFQPALAGIDVSHEGVIPSA